jgi:hypothetical protein
MTEQDDKKPVPSPFPALPEATPFAGQFYAALAAKDDLATDIAIHPSYDPAKNNSADLLAAAYHDSHDTFKAIMLKGADPSAIQYDAMPDEYKTPEIREKMSGWANDFTNSRAVTHIKKPDPDWKVISPGSEPWKKAPTVKPPWATQVVHRLQREAAALVNDPVKYGQTALQNTVTYGQNMWNSADRFGKNILFDIAAPLQVEILKKNLLTTEYGTELMQLKQQHGWKINMLSSLSGTGAGGYINVTKPEIAHLNPSLAFKTLNGVAAHEMTHQFQTLLIGEDVKGFDGLPPAEAVAMNNLIEAHARLKQETFLIQYDQKNGTDHLGTFYGQAGIPIEDQKHAQQTEAQRMEKWMSHMANDRNDYAKDFARRSFGNMLTADGAPDKAPLLSKEDGQTAVISVARKLDTTGTLFGHLTDAQILETDLFHHNSYVRLMDMEYHLALDTAAGNNPRPVLAQEETGTKPTQDGQDKQPATVTPDQTPHHVAAEDSYAQSAVDAPVSGDIKTKLHAIDHKMTKTHNRTNLLLSAAEGNYAAMGVDLAMNGALDVKTVNSAAKLTKSIAPVAKALGTFGKKIPIVGMAVTAGYVLYRVGDNAIDGNWGRAGTELVAGAGEVVGNFVGFGAGDAAREGIRGGIVLMGGDEYAPEKSDIRLMGERFMALGSRGVDGGMMPYAPVVPPADARQIINDDPAFPASIDYNGRTVIFTDALADKTFRENYIKAVGEAQIATGDDFSEQLAKIDAFANLLPTPAAESAFVRNAAADNTARVSVHTRVQTEMLELDQRKKDDAFRRDEFAAIITRTAPLVTPAAQSQDNNQRQVYSDKFDLSQYQTRSASESTYIKPVATPPKISDPQQEFLAQEATFPKSITVGNKTIPFHQALQDPSFFKAFKAEVISLNEKVDMRPEIAALDKFAAMEKQRLENSSALEKALTPASPPVKFVPQKSIQPT